ncbi:hypothetical protein MP477_22410 [Chryseobacterium sp. WG23]|uniref:hypothetical protein n=1 Tax=Chryseobacterium sp. WG23 TaxID=2926910 RepID=UPI00211EAC4F|nr:hypothetical protein [Chryseobacterium sp. WG23]MCQ9637716.1 hypothetical protein [Chryseobacterium sp. WG23]
MKSTASSKAPRLFPFLQRLSISIALIFAITSLQIYWSVGQFSDHTSSSCLECSLFEDTIYMSAVTSVFLSAIFLLFSFVKKIFIKVAIEFLLLISLWIFWNYSIFVDRESSWSTYDFSSEFYYTIDLSVLPVLSLGCLCILLLHYKEIKVRFSL